MLAKSESIFPWGRITGDEVPGNLRAGCSLQLEIEVSSQANLSGRKAEVLKGVCIYGKFAYPLEEFFLFISSFYPNFCIMGKIAAVHFISSVKTLVYPLWY